MVARGPGARLTCCYLTRQAVPESHRMMASLSIQVIEVLSPPWVVVLIHTLPTEPSSLSSHNQLVLFRVPDLRLEWDSESGCYQATTTSGSPGFHLFLCLTGGSWGCWTLDLLRKQSKTWSFASTFCVWGALPV